MILLFGGTTEGRAAARVLDEAVRFSTPPKAICKRSGAATAIV